MAADEDNSRKNKGRGFGGFSSLLSDVDTSVPDTTQDAAKGLSRQADAQTTATQSASPKHRPTPPRPYKAPQPQPPQSAAIWVVSIVAVIVVLWIAIVAGENSTAQSANYSQTPSTMSGAGSDSSDGGGSVSNGSAIPPPVDADFRYPASRPERTYYDIPPTGRNLVLSVAQIRYCLAESYVLDGAKLVVDAYRDADVKRFNGMITDYNSRCSAYRYRQGDLESARGEIEPNRSRLQATGRQLFAHSHLPGAQGLPTVATIRAVQRRLNQLGYNAGVIDGLMGGKTRSAIRAFQRSEGLVPDGHADTALLASLNATAAN